MLLDTCSRERRPLLTLHSRNSHSIYIANQSIDFHMIRRWYCHSNWIYWHMYLTRKLWWYQFPFYKCSSLFREIPFVPLRFKNLFKLNIKVTAAVFWTLFQSFCWLKQVLTLWVVRTWNSSLSGVALTFGFKEIENISDKSSYLPRTSPTGINFGNLKKVEYFAGIFHKWRIL